MERAGEDSELESRALVRGSREDSLSIRFRVPRGLVGLVLRRPALGGGKLAPKFVLVKAKQLAAELLKEKFALGSIGILPTIDKHWLLSWARGKGVVLRNRNCCFKASSDVVRGSLRAMRLKTLRVRALAQASVGDDLAVRI